MDDKKVIKKLSISEIEILNTPAYQQWIKDLESLKKDQPEEFRRVFSKRKNSHIQDLIVKTILND